MRLSYRTLSWSEKQFAIFLLTIFAMSPALAYILFGSDLEFAAVAFMVVISVGIGGYLMSNMSLNDA